MNTEIWKQKTAVGADQIQGSYKFDSKLPLYLRNQSGKPNHKDILPANKKSETFVPKTDIFTTARVEGQPEFLFSRENYMKMKRAGAQIPDFAHQPDHTGPRKQPFESNNIYLKTDLNPLLSTEPHKKRVEQLQSITEDSKPQMESNLNPIHRHGRYQPGMIGWGVNANYLVDRQPLEKTHILKQNVRVFDETKLQQWTQGPINRATEFDKDVKTDLSAYRRMNMQSQRATVKSLDIQNQHERISHLNNSFAVGSQMLTNPNRLRDTSATVARLNAVEARILQSSVKAQNMTPQMAGESQMRGNVNFKQMVNSLCSNAFNANNSINNTNGAAYTKRHGTLDQTLNKVPNRLKEQRRYNQS